MKISKVIFLILFFFGFTAASAGAASQRKTIAAVPTDGPIKIDGVLSEPVWASEGRSDFTQSDPLDGRLPTEKTTIWIGFDEDNLYVAARLADAEPGKIIGLLGRRDDQVDSDWFYVGIDPYSDRRSGYFFAVNPAGSRLDGTLFNDEGKDLTWDGIWESAARVDAEGWTVEMRIPFHQLRFKKKDSYVWGVGFRRDIKRKNETDNFNWVPKEESGFVSRFADLTGIGGIDPGRRIEFLPFVMSRAGFSPEQPGNPFKTGHEFTGNSGFDFKAGLKSNLTLDITVNPDFGQVEVDPAVINISDQETYYVEKRPFFIEGSSLFNFGTGGANSYQSFGWTNPAFFYSRRIGRTPQGSVTTPGSIDFPDWATILAAAKVTGKIGKDFNIGFINAFTRREYAEVDQNGERSEVEVEPFTNYGVLRGLKEFDAGRQGLGFMATSAVRDLRTASLSAALKRASFSFAADGWTFLDKDDTWVITGWLGATRVTGSAAAMTRLQTSSLHYFQRPDIDYVQVDPQATSLSGWAGRIYLNKQKGNLVFNAGLGAMSPGFEANDLGYHTRGDVINGHVQFGYQTFHPDKVFRRWILSGAYYRNYDFGGHRIGEYVYLDATGQLLNYWSLGLHLEYEPPKYSHYLTRGGPMALYPSGETIRGEASSDNRNPLVVGLKGYYRTHPTGGYNWSMGLSLVWKPRPNISLSVGPSYTWRYSQGEWVTKVVDPLMTATYGTRYILADIIQKTLPLEIRLNWTFTPTFSLQAYLQPYIGTGDYREFKELRAARTFDFHFFGKTDDSTLVYDSGLYTVDPDGSGPAAPFSFQDPDFSLKSLRGTIVLRWEFRPGSMLYFVWTQRRADDSDPGDFDLGRDMGDLFRAPGDNVFMLKFSYRFQL
jgi:hypothetical protein